MNGGRREGRSHQGDAVFLNQATSAMRDADNATAVLARIRAEITVALQVLSGEDEARYTFLAVRRWHGWSAGRLLVLDIGGGSLELATGRDEDPDIADVGLRQLLGFIPRMASADLACLDGVSTARAHQMLAGALVVAAAMRALGVRELHMCPWALREGVILRRLDTFQCRPRCS
jgi:exopolyphosphatase/pppGpp-phosphohydrolase